MRGFTSSRAFLFLALCVFALVGPISVIDAPSACAQEGKVALVVKQSDEDEKSDCVDIPGETSGIDVLNRSNFEVVTKDFGGDLGLAVCKIGSTGTDDCDFAKGFWNYFQTDAGKWVASQKGASSSKVSPRAVEGWVWVAGGGDPNAAPVPPDTEPVFDQICRAAATPAARTTEDAGNSALPWIIGGAALVVVIVVVLLLRSRSSP